MISPSPFYLTVYVNALAMNIRHRSLFMAGGGGGGGGSTEEKRLSKVKYINTILSE